MMSKFCLFFFKQKTAYEMRISDWSSDVCSSDLELAFERVGVDRGAVRVEGDLESRAFEVGDAIDDAAVVEVGPDRQFGRGEARVALRRPEMINLLPRRADLVHKLLRDELDRKSVV